MPDKESLDNFGDWMQDLSNALKSISQCGSIEENIQLIKELVAKLCSEAQKVDLKDSDFLDFEKELHRCQEILNQLEEPSKSLGTKARELKPLLGKMIETKKLQPGVVSQLKAGFQEMLTTGKECASKMSDFVNGMNNVRVLCEKAKKNAEAVMKGVEKLEPSKRQEATNGIAKGAGIVAAGSGLGAAVALGLATFFTGGTALLVTAAGAAIGGASLVKGGAVATKAVLSAHELSKKADEIRKTVNSLESALKSIDHFEEKLKGEVVKLTDEMVRSLQIGLELFNQYQENVRERETLRIENQALRNDKQESQRREFEQMKENQELRRELEQMKLGRAN